MSITSRRSDAQETEQLPTVAPATKGRKGAKQQKAPAAPKAPAAAKTAGRAESLDIGTEPRVDLLPPEVRRERKNKATRRGFGWGVLVVFLVVVLGVGGAFAYNVAAQARLLGAQLSTADLLTQQQKFTGVRDVQKEVALAQAAQRVGASAEVDWKALLDQIGAVQPAGVALETVAADSASPLAVYQQSQDPLQAARIGTVTTVSASPTVPDITTWMRALAKIPGVTDVVPSTLALDPTTNQYKVTITLHIDQSRYAKRFEQKDK
jgi:cytoskeletal protein RodZ